MSPELIAFCVLMVAVFIKSFFDVRQNNRWARIEEIQRKNRLLYHSGELLELAERLGAVDHDDRNAILTMKIDANVLVQRVREKI